MEIDRLDELPEENADQRILVKHNNTRGSQTKLVAVTIFGNYIVQINAIEL